MAEGGAGHSKVKDLSNSRSRQNQRQHQKVVDDSETPLVQNIIFKKRPPRRPKLKNGFLAPLKNNVNVQSFTNTTFEDSIAEGSKNVLSTAQIDCLVKSFEKKLKSLHLDSHKSPVIEVCKF